MILRLRPRLSQGYYVYQICIHGVLQSLSLTAVTTWIMVLSEAGIPTDHVCVVASWARYGFIYIYTHIYRERDREREMCIYVYIERERDLGCSDHILCVYIYIYIYTHTYIYIYIYTYICVHRCVCMYIYIYIYISAAAITFSVVLRDRDVHGLWFDMLFKELLARNTCTIQTEHRQSQTSDEGMGWCV